MTRTRLIYIQRNTQVNFKSKIGHISSPKLSAKYQLWLTLGLRSKMEFHQSITSTETSPLP